MRPKAPHLVVIKRAPNCGAVCRLQSLSLTMDSFPLSETCLAWLEMQIMRARGNNGRSWGCT